jgi:CubicO group peptidase (beta-lactamase class C family)
MTKRIFVLALALGFIITNPTALSARNLDLERKIKSSFEAGELSGLHSVLVMRDGEVFAEVFLEGPDEKWGRPIGKRQHGPATLHDLRSVTKSIVGLLYGIALLEGLVPEVDKCLVCQFPEYQDLAADSERRKILIRHALSMRMGTKWNEDLPYSNPENSEIAMELAEDRYRFVLDRPMIQEPGESWTYNGGATAIIAHLIAKGTGRKIDQYAKEKLFDPLNITDYEWVRGFDGEPSAASGLRLNAHDLAKVGQMILAEGSANGKQIVPARWLQASFTPHSTLRTGLRYGYFWWLAADRLPPRWVAGFGNGGQRLSVNKRIGVVIVVFAGNYNKPSAWKLPVKIIVDFIVPALER